MHLAKLHGLGNDFLVLVDLDDATPIDAGLAAALCDRRRGIGADGLIRVTPGTDGADLTMALRNADGSVAEMSGNGVRCLALAVARHRGVDELHLTVATGGGVRAVSLRAGPLGTSQVDVDMGKVRPGPEPDTGWLSLPVTARLLQGPESEHPGLSTLDLGNPHLVVLVDDPSAVDLADAGPVTERQFAQGINVGFVALSAGELDALDLRVWERGAGITEACGTGAAAAAHAVHEWGLVGERVTVHLPGGDVEVVLGDTVTLSGPAVHVADCVVDDD
ncbi:MAG: diaminopimelate epimerase, partial [Acidimicrobiales bacterium]